MKKLIFLCTILFSTILLTSFKQDVAPKLYPELESYFKTLDAKQFNPEHVQSLENIKYDIKMSNTISENFNLIFYCSENTFRSQASQVFAETLCYVRKHKKVSIFSAGLTNGTINPILISYLKKVGYKITSIQKDDKPAYEVRYSDQADPIILFSKTVSDQSLPKTEVTSVIVCDITKEIDCAPLTTQSRPFNLAFPKVQLNDEGSKAEAVLKTIATEMLFVTNK